MLSSEATHVLAILVLAVLAMLLAAGFWHWLRGHPHYSAGQRICYFYGYVIARILWRTEVVGRLEMPSDQAAIVVSNHRCPYDPAFIQLAADRVVHWMVAKEYCRHPALAWFFRTVESIPVSRAGVDTAATRAAIRYAQTGDLVGLFPEGRINDSSRLLLPGRPGAALIAIRTGLPIVPCYISGAPVGTTILSTMFVPARTRLTIGRPIDISRFLGREKDRRAIEQLTRLMLQEIACLAGQGEFQPTLAGRRWMADV